MHNADRTDRTDRSDSTDRNPELAPDGRNREAAGDLPGRLSELPRSHPSSADYARAGYDGARDIRIGDRRAHILDGDRNGGGHRHGTGRPGKTEFPADWSDDRIAGAILAVARNPDQAPQHQNWNDRWRVSGQRDDVRIFAIVESDGRIWTAWPDESSPGVVKNAVKDI